MLREWCGAGHRFRAAALLHGLMKRTGRNQPGKAEGWAGIRRAIGEGAAACGRKGFGKFREQREIKTAEV